MTTKKDVKEKRNQGKKLDGITKEVDRVKKEEKDKKKKKK